MGKSIDEVISEEAEAVAQAERVEARDDDHLLANVSVTRGGTRSRNLQVRFRDEEFAEVLAYAEQRGLPVSTVVRALVLQAITPADDLESALDKLELDLVALRRAVLSA